jgi:hypothetical protein
MSQFFPVTGKQVVPLVRMDDEDGITFVQARHIGSKHEEGAKVRIFRFAIGKFIKASVIKIDSPDAMIGTANPEANGSQDVVIWPSSS